MKMDKSLNMECKVIILYQIILFQTLFRLSDNDTRQTSQDWCKENLGRTFLSHACAHYV